MLSQDRFASLSLKSQLVGSLGVGRACGLAPQAIQEHIQFPSTSSASPWHGVVTHMVTAEEGSVGQAVSL